MTIGRQRRAIALTRRRFAPGARWHWCAILLAGALSCRAGSQAPALQLFEGEGGTTCEFFNYDAQVPWRQRKGDWLDAAGALHGDQAHARSRVRDLDRRQAVQWDITDLVKAWLHAQAGEGAVLLKSSADSKGTVEFYSREHADTSLHPLLIVELVDGSKIRLQAGADTSLDCSTYRSLGTRELLHLGARETNAVLSFPLESLPREAAIGRAHLQLVTRETQYGEAEIEVMQMHAPLPAAAQSAGLEQGLAANYEMDAGIGEDPDVWFHCDFEAPDWAATWSDGTNTRSFDIVGAGDELGFAPLAGAALRVKMAKDQHYGLNLRYLFKSKTGAEPEEAYFRYYLRLATDWHQTLDGGKLPGFSGTYDRAGWGGRRVDGTDGWSLRGAFWKQASAGSPLEAFQVVGTYAYHTDMKGTYGDIWAWTKRGLGGALARERWYAIEQHVKMNTPGKNDGVLRAWVDGVLVFEKTDLNLRNTPQLKIEAVWFNVYHGGRLPSPHDQHLFIDNVVIAKKYIGPTRVK